MLGNEVATRAPEVETPRDKDGSTRRRGLRRPGPTLIAAIVFAALAAWLFSASLFGGKVLSGNDLLFFESPFSAAKPAELRRPSNPWVYDAIYVFHPDLQLVRSLIHSGQLPLWNSFSDSGRPLWPHSRRRRCSR